MEQECLLKRLYEELKVQFNTENSNKDVDLNDEVLCNESMNELIEEYQKEYRKLQEKLRELKKQEIKEAQRKQLAKYCKTCCGIEIPMNEKKENVADKEKKILEQLEEKQQILDILMGKSKLGASATEDIKYGYIISFRLKNKKFKEHNQ